MLTTKKIIFVFLFANLLNIFSYANNNISTNINILKLIYIQKSNIREMLETYSFIGLHIVYKGDPKEELKLEIRNYEKTIKTLEKFKKNDSLIVTNIQNGKYIWKPIKEKLLTVLSNPNKQTIQKDTKFIHDNIRKLIVCLENIQIHIIKNDNFQTLHIFNAASELASASSRLGAHYMMKVWGFNDPTIEQHWNKGIIEYRNSLATLKKSSLMNNPKAKNLILECDKYLNYFIHIYSMKQGIPILMHEKYLKVNRYIDDILNILIIQISKK